MQHDQFARTLLDLRDEFQWIRLLGWSDEQLSSVPIHEEDPAGTERINLADAGGTSLGVSTSRLADPTSADTSGIRNIWVVKNETPAELYRQLEQIVREGMTGYQAGQTGNVNWPEERA